MMKHNDNNIAALILAAGKGTRMKSDLPKVLHELLKKPMLWYLLQTMSCMNFSRKFVITGHGHDLLEKTFPGDRQDFILQAEQLGTGHALQTAWPIISNSNADWLVVANGDTPLVSAEHLELLISRVSGAGADAGLLSLDLDDPADYGRVIRDIDGRIRAIIEASDYDPELHGPCPREVNSGIYMFRISALSEILFELDHCNNQQELYITQLITLADKKNMKIAAVSAGNCPELLGINNPAQLVGQEEYLRAMLVEHLIAQGVLIRNKDQVRVGPETRIEPGADITGPCEIYGDSFIGRGTKISSHCYIEDSSIVSGEIFSFSHIVKSDIKEQASIGPFARLRPGTRLESRTRAGNFVEIKNSSIGECSKVNHLSYIGDTEVGPEVNIGAGTITCNYDGKDKHRTIIEQQAFIGSNTALVAPVRVGRRSIVGAGSTITLDVPEDSLAVARARQKNIAGRNTLKKS